MQRLRYTGPAFATAPGPPGASATGPRSPRTGLNLIARQSTRRYGSVGLTGPPPTGLLVTTLFVKWPNCAQRFRRKNRTPYAPYPRNLSYFGPPPGSPNVFSANATVGAAFGCTVSRDPAGDRADAPSNRCGALGRAQRASGRTWSSRRGPPSADRRRRASAGGPATRCATQNRNHGEGLLRVPETMPGRGAVFFCGVFRTAAAAEAGGGRPATVVVARARALRDDVGPTSRLACDDYGKRVPRSRRPPRGASATGRSLRMGLKLIARQSIREGMGP